MLGALPYVGLTLASPLAGRIFAYWPAKRVVIISMALNAFATLLMVLTLLLPHEVLPLASSSGGGEEAIGDAASAAVTSLAAAAPAAEIVPDAGPAATAAVDAAATSSSPFFRLPDFSFGDLTPSALLLLSSRLLVGVTQAPFVIFAPVWVDEFAPPKKAALWMGVMQGAAVVGVTVSHCHCLCYFCCCCLQPLLQQPTGLSAARISMWLSSFHLGFYLCSFSPMLLVIFLSFFRGFSLVLGAGWLSGCWRFVCVFGFQLAGGDILSGFLPLCPYGAHC